MTRLTRRFAAAIISLVLVMAAVVLGERPAAASVCPTATYNGTSYCIGTISDLNAGVYPAGTRVVLRQVIVDSGSGSIRTLTSPVSKPCSPGEFCGADTITWVYATVDFRHARSAPPLYYYVDVYGTVTTTRTVTPTGYILGAYAGNPAFW